MPVLAEVQHIVESAGILDGGVDPRRTHGLLVPLRGILDIVIAESVIGICIHASVHFGIQLPLLYEFGLLYILEIFPFSSLLLQLVGLELHILDETVASPECISLEGIMH